MPPFEPFDLFGTQQGLLAFGVFSIGEPLTGDPNAIVLQGRREDGQIVNGSLTLGELNGPALLGQLEGQPATLEAFFNQSDDTAPDPEIVTLSPTNDSERYLLTVPDGGDIARFQDEFIFVGAVGSPAIRSSNSSAIASLQLPPASDVPGTYSLLMHFEAVAADPPDGSQLIEIGNLTIVFDSTSRGWRCLQGSVQLSMFGQGGYRVGQFILAIFVSESSLLIEIDDLSSGSMTLDTGDLQQGLASPIVVGSLPMQIRGVGVLAGIGENLASASDRNVQFKRRPEPIPAGETFPGLQFETLVSPRRLNRFTTTTPLLISDGTQDLPSSTFGRRLDEERLKQDFGGILENLTIAAAFGQGNTPEFSAQPEVANRLRIASGGQLCRSSTGEAAMRAGDGGVEFLPLPPPRLVPGPWSVFVHGERTTPVTGGTAGIFSLGVESQLGSLALSTQATGAGTSLIITSRPEDGSPLQVVTADNNGFAPDGDAEGAPLPVNQTFTLVFSVFSVTGNLNLFLIIGGQLFAENVDLDAAAAGQLPFFVGSDSQRNPSEAFHYLAFGTSNQALGTMAAQELHNNLVNSK